jgi:hypothetical protein
VREANRSQAAHAKAKRGGRNRHTFRDKPPVSLIKVRDPNPHGLPLGGLFNARKGRHKARKRARVVYTRAH